MVKKIFQTEVSLPISMSEMQFSNFRNGTFWNNKMERVFTKYGWLWKTLQKWRVISTFALVGNTLLSPRIFRGLGRELVMLAGMATFFPPEPSMDGANVLSLGVMWLGSTSSEILTLRVVEGEKLDSQHWSANFVVNREIWSTEPEAVTWWTATLVCLAEVVPR